MKSRFPRSKPARGVVRPEGPGSLDHTPWVLLRVCKVVFGAVVFLLLVSLALLPTVGRGGLVAMANLRLLALGLPILSIAARRPRAPRAPVPVHWGLVRLYLKWIWIDLLS